MKKLLIILILSANAQAFEVAPDVDTRKPIYARGDVIVCNSREALMLGLNAKNTNWHYVATAGVKPPKPIKSGQKISPEDIGCKTVPDSWPLVFVGDQFTSIETTDGFTIHQMIKN